MSCPTAERPDLDGRDLTPLLADPDAPWDRPVITTFDYGEYSIRDERFRYIRYIDGGEELYDHDADPEEWTNLADDPAAPQPADSQPRGLPEPEALATLASTQKNRRNASSR